MKADRDISILSPGLSVMLSFCSPAMSPKWNEMAIVGRIARAHGRRGQVVVAVETDFPEQRFRPGAELFVEGDGVPRLLTLTSVRFQRHRPIVAIDGVKTMDDAEALAGHELRVPVEKLTPLPHGTFYRHDLVGCRVETRDGRTIGAVKEVEGALNGSRLVVARGKDEILIPLASDICTTIDVDAKRILIDPPNGLLDLNK